MPYRMTWVPGCDAQAPTDESLVMHKERPPGVFHYCAQCDGWIDGRANRFREDTLGPLSGRRGTAEHCLRCGHCIGFFGEVS